MPRRDAIMLLSAATASLFMPAAAWAASDRLGPASAFSWAWLVQRARQLAGQPHQPQEMSRNPAPDFDSAGRLTYGQAEAVAGNIRLFPTSRATAPSPVHIAIVEGGKAREIINTTGLFANDGTADPAGFRVMDASGLSDWLAWQGASYFRSSGNRDQYGLSARAIAIDTGLPEGEEFPAFTHFWIEQAGQDKTLVHALLDGPSLAGAFSFDCRKTAASVTQDVKGVLFMRRDVKQLGLAPASSMFWYDQSSPPRQRDWRPEIHDSDGLAIWAGNGERVWRPLDNPAVARLHSLRADSPKGFGLLQRDQQFDHYQDDGAFYDLRPSLWVEPKGDWGPGAVGLYEMPTDSETLDNIAMFWRSDKPSRKGERKEFAYRLTWTSNDPTLDGTARCVDVFDGPGGIPGAPPLPGARKFVFDFAGPSLAGLERSSGVVAETDLTKDALISVVAYPVARVKDRWRVMIDVRTQKMANPEFRLFLRHGNTALSETVIKAIET